MIEINLLPGSAKRTKKRGVPKLGMPGPLSNLKGLPKFDRSLALMAGGWAVGLLLFAWLFFGTRARKAELEEQITVAERDSMRLASIIESSKSMEARRNTVAEKLTIVQGIDAARYIWSHILDEAARSLPEHTWLEEVTYVVPDSTDKFPKFKVEGRTGNNFALTAYLQQLEASPFIRAVKLNSSELVREDQKLVYAFLLEAYFEEPPPDVLETTPLFTRAEEPDTVARPNRVLPPQAPAAQRPAPGARRPAPSGAAVPQTRTTQERP